MKFQAMTECTMGWGHNFMLYCHKFDIPCSSCYLFLVYLL